MNLTSRWTGGPYYLTPEQRKWTQELFERALKQRKKEKAMTGEPIKSGTLVQQLEINLSEETKKFLLEALKPEPVKHGYGEWLFRTNLYPGNGMTAAGYVCSVCGNDTREPQKYCSNCGRAMITR